MTIADFTALSVGDSFLFLENLKLKGAEATTQLAAVLLHPSANPGFIDIVWVSGFWV